MENDLRQKRYKKIEGLEALFGEMEMLMNDSERRAIDKLSRPAKPVFLIVGCARSGSTLLYQYLASTGLFSFPTNLISRFYFAPYIGARIQQMLVDFDTKGEIFPLGHKADFTSDLGKTFGPVQPHEFWYFWDRFFKFGDIQQLSDADLGLVDTTLFLKELAGLEHVLGKSLLMKAMKMNWHIPYLASLADNIYFVYIKRNVLYNAQSLLLARKKFFGNYDEWYSFRPPNYALIRQKPNYAQVIDQVHENNNAVEAGLSKIPAGRHFSVEYEEFCRDPNFALKKLFEGLALDERQIKNSSTAFAVGNKQMLDDSLWQKLNEYYLYGGKS